MIQKKNIDLVKSFQTSIYLQKLASIQPRTSLRKGQKMYARKDPVGDNSPMGKTKEEALQRCFSSEVSIFYLFLFILSCSAIGVVSPLP